MDYVSGKDLGKYVKITDLSVEQVISIFTGILCGVNAIHEQHIVHRDLKPANIYITQSGEVKILDFGLSKLIDFTSITSTGAEIGSPLYMSPEQVKDSKNIDYRSDYYALGVILFELLTKNNPYGKVQSRAELYFKIINEPPMSVRQFLPTISNEIDNLISALLEKENYKRPNTADEILMYLKNPAESSSLTTPQSFMPSFFYVHGMKKALLNHIEKMELMLKIISFQ